MWRLLETIKDAVKFKDILWMARVLKPRRLLHIDVFIEKTMKKGIADINLTKTPSSRYNKRQHKKNSDRLDHGLNVP
jgi:hypothetical protein